MLPLIALLTSAVGPVSPSAERLDVLDKALGARDRLGPNYYIVLTFTLDEMVPGTGQWRRTVRDTLAIWVRDKLFRTDQTASEFPGNPDAVGRRNIRCRNCERPGFVLVTGTGSSRDRRTVTFQPLAKYEPNDPWRIDWRRLGQLPAMLGMYKQETPDAVLRSLKEVGRDPVERSVRDGHPCLVVHSPFGDGVRHTWFRSDLGMNPVFVDEGIPKSEYKQTTEITYAKYSGADVWFPKTILVSHSTGGRQPKAFREHISIEKAEFNATIPDNVFTLAGLGLEDGQAIVYPGTKPGDEPIWRNGTFDKNDTAAKAAAAAMEQMMTQPPVPDAPPSSDRGLYYAGAAVLTLLAAGLAAFARRSRKS